MGFISASGISLYFYFAVDFARFISIFMFSAALSTSAFGAVGARKAMIPSL